MSAERRGQGPLKIDMPSGSAATGDLPPLAAVFVIHFDVRKGYASY